MSPSESLSLSVSPEDAETQLQRVISSSTFLKSERLSRFLSFTVRATIEGRSSIVKESVLALEVFDRDSNYDPRVDSVVRVQASRLRVKLKEYYEREGADDSIEITYPRGTYVPVFVKKGPAVEIVEAVAATPPPAEARSDRWRYFAYAALWVLSVVVGHLLIAAGESRFPWQAQHSTTPDEIVRPHTAVQPVTSRDFTPLHEPAALRSKL